jgi:predicted enzyme involved in methoxymalonyl-ACP biosynthesis
MSCRVQRKRVEAAFFAWLTRRIAADRDVVEVAYRKTARNHASVRMLEELEFAFRPEGGTDEGCYVRAARKPFVEDHVVQVDDCTRVTADVA